MLTVSRSLEYTEDFLYRTAWYVGEGGPELGWRFEEAVDATIQKVARQPTLGRIRRFRHPSLQALRSIRVIQPFGSILIFYRFDSTTVQVWRMMHGARDLGRRLLEPNE